jgi:outer membrane lipoprotein-sorting protein
MNTNRKINRVTATDWWRLGLALLFCCQISPALVAADTPEAVVPPLLQEFNRNMNGVNTVFCRFTQSRHLSLFKEPLQSAGYLCFQKPGKVRWETDQPYRSILVSDGAGVAQFEWTDERWQKLDIGLAAAMQNVVAQIAGIFEAKFTANHRDYAVTVTNTAAGPVVILTPRAEVMRKMMKAIEVHLAPDLKRTRAVVLRENDGDYTEIVFAGQVAGTEFPRQTFDLNKPVDIQAVAKAAHSQEPRP